MTPITEYTKNGFYYQLVERRGDWAIFKQCAQIPTPDPNQAMAWEVFKIHVSKEAEMMVKNKEGEQVLVKFEPKECGPSNEDFGSKAFSCNSLQRAYQKLEECLQNEAENKLRREARVLNK